MDYIITDEGLRVLREEGLTRIVDENFDEVSSLFLTIGTLMT